MIDEPLTAVHLRGHLLPVLAALAAAISLLERSPKVGAPSDKMFDIMLSDYRHALENARSALAKVEAR